MIDDEFLNNLRPLLHLAEDEEELDIKTTAPVFCSLSGNEVRYKDFKLIAKGGMKRISRVFDIKTNRYVAMAQLHEDSSVDFYDSFIREARLTALLDHPNIIEFVHFFEGAKNYFIVLEYIEGAQSL